MSRFRRGSESAQYYGLDSALICFKHIIYDTIHETESVNCILCFIYCDHDKLRLLNSWPISTCARNIVVCKINTVPRLISLMC